METTQTNTDPNSLESIRAILREISESQKESDRRYAEWQEEYAKRQEEHAKWQEEQDKKHAKWLEEHERQREKDNREWKEKAAEFDKKMGKLGNRLGEWAEYILTPKLIEKFKKLGFVFERTHQHSKYEDMEGRINAEADFVFENGEYVMIGEVKSKVSIKDIDEHVERMEKIRAFVDMKDDKRKYVGVIAAMVIGDSERDFALKSGFYVVEPSGETFVITVPEGKYSPREW